MKRIIFAAFILLSLNASAQLRLNVYTNYVFNDRVENNYDATHFYTATIKGGFQWGGGLEYLVNPMTGIELFYNRQDTKAPVQNFDYPLGAEYDVAVNYILMNFTRYMRKPGGKVEGFGGLGLGAGIVDSKDPDGRTQSNTKFAWQARGGAIIWASESVGIRLQAQLQSCVQGVGGGIYFGTGGAGVAATSYSSMLQFGLGSGVVFKFHTSASKAPQQGATQF